MSAHTIIIGGGAAGFFSAIWAKNTNPDSRVIIIEKSDSVLAKVLISGGGRCNVTHACFDPKELCEHYPRGSKELRGPMSRFQPRDTISWFESHGVMLKTEDDNRIFPMSDSSQSIYDCLVDTARDIGVDLWTQCDVQRIEKLEYGFRLFLGNGRDIDCKKLILATGSNRSGYELAKQLGHRIVDPVPSLFTFKINDPELLALQGLSVANVDVYLDGFKKQPRSGPLLITHWGVSGPAIIKLSAWHARTLHERSYGMPLHVHWLPALSESDLSDIIRHHMAVQPKKLMVSQSPFPTLPKRLWAYLLKKSGIADTLTWIQLHDKHRKSLISHLMDDRFTITGKGSFKDEFVTCGGIALNEINFKSMESKLVPGLYCVGELLDIDGITGGFNFQNAWTTGYLAGISS